MALRLGEQREALYHATPNVTQGLRFSGLIHGLPHLVAFYDTKGNVEDLFSPKKFLSINCSEKNLSKNAVRQVTNAL